MPKHRTTVYVDHELVLVSKARGINISEALERTLRSLVGDFNGEERIEKLRKELEILETAQRDKESGPLAQELRKLRRNFEGRERMAIGLNENWVRGVITDYPHVRARFTVDEILDLLTGE